uniref:Letm1 RBD domain-containing protein n=1 Tax=Calcidiscus leptoporus TaxID=127549 RepID=A0A7S0IMW7_9EUKA
MVALGLLLASHSASLAVLQASAAPSLEIMGQELDLNPVNAIKSMPSQMGSALRKFQTGMGGIRRNWQEADAINKRVKRGGAPASYQEVTLLRKKSEDNMKLLQAGFVYLAAPELATAVLYFSPKMLPSTFEGEEGRLNRWRQLSRLRSTAVVQLLWALDDEAVRKGRRGLRGAERVERARQLLLARSPLRAARVVEDYTRPVSSSQQVAKKPLDGIPKPLLVAACRMIGIKFAPLPSMRRQALHKHLQNLIDEDAALARTDWASLSHSELMDACLDRGLGGLGDSDKELRELLRGWRELTDEARFVSEAVPPDAARLRLAALAVCAVGSCRREKAKLPSVLYSP